jgi:poly(A) polymerase
MERRETHFSLDATLLTLLQQCATYFAQQQQTVYLVGGSVRNLLLHEPFTDWDFAISGNVPLTARKLADYLQGFCAHMHEKASRVIVKRDGREFILDLAPLYHAIEDDLHQRDFTLNAIALPFASLLDYLVDATPLEIIDPLHGLDDLHSQTLRAVNASIFLADPLRLLRAVRFLIRYKLSLDPQTALLIQRDSHLLLQAASERIHDELYTILQFSKGTFHLRLLDSLNLLTVLFPELLPARAMLQPELHYWDVFDHSLETVSMLELLLQTLELSPTEISSSPLESHDNLLALQGLLQEAEQQTLFHFSQMLTPPMKLAALFHDIGKPPTYTRDDHGTIRFYGHPQAGVPLSQDIMRRLHASAQDRRLMQQVVAHHMRPGQLSHDQVTERAIRRFFVELGPAGLSVGLISLADHLSMRGPLPLTHAWQRHLSTVRLLFTRYIRERSLILPPRLLQGEELIHRLALKPGPIIGQLLDLISDAQADGRVHSKDEALWLAEEYLSQEKSRNREM